jgi:hypothetical protein
MILKRENALSLIVISTLFTLRIASYSRTRETRKESYSVAYHTDD